MRHDLNKPAPAVELPEDLPRVHPPLFSRGAQGKFVSVRKAGEGERTKLGILLGDMEILVTAGQREDGTLVVRRAMRNPAIYVLDDMQVVYGAESWWGPIKGPEHLREITDGDIEGVWYVQALKQLERDAEERATREAAESAAGGPDVG